MKLDLRIVAYGLSAIGVLLVIVSQAFFPFSYAPAEQLSLFGVLIGLLGLVTYAVYKSRQSTEIESKPSAPANAPTTTGLRKVFSDVRVQAFSIAVVIVIISEIAIVESYRSGLIGYQQNYFIETLTTIAIAPIASIFYLILDKKKSRKHTRVT